MNEWTSQIDCGRHAAAAAAAAASASPERVRAALIESLHAQLGGIDAAAAVATTTTTTTTTTTAPAVAVHDRRPASSSNRRRTDPALGGGVFGVAANTGGGHSSDEEACPDYYAPTPDMFFAPDPAAAAVAAATRLRRTHTGSSGSTAAAPLLRTPPPQPPLPPSTRSWSGGGGGGGHPSARRTAWSERHPSPATRRPPMSPPARSRSRSRSSRGGGGSRGDEERSCGQITEFMLQMLRETEELNCKALALGGFAERRGQWGARAHEKRHAMREHVAEVLREAYAAAAESVRWAVSNLACREDFLHHGASKHCFQTTAELQRFQYSPAAQGQNRHTCRPGGVVANPSRTHAELDNVYAALGDDGQGRRASDGRVRRTRSLSSASSPSSPPRGGAARGGGGAGRHTPQRQQAAAPTAVGAALSSGSNVSVSVSASPRPDIGGDSSLRVPTAAVSASPSAERPVLSATTSDAVTDDPLGTHARRPVLSTPPTTDLLRASVGAAFPDPPVAHAQPTEQPLPLSSSTAAAARRLTDPVPRVVPAPVADTATSSTSDAGGERALYPSASSASVQRSTPGLGDIPLLAGEVSLYAGDVSRSGSGSSRNDSDSDSDSDSDRRISSVAHGAAAVDPFAAPEEPHEFTVAGSRSRSGSSNSNSSSSDSAKDEHLGGTRTTVGYPSVGSVHSLPIVNQITSSDSESE